MTLVCMLSRMRGMLQFAQKYIVVCLLSFRNMNITDTSVLCSAAKKMGTSHSKLQTEQDSWMLGNLHFNSQSTQKCQVPQPYKMIH